MSLLLSFPGQSLLGAEKWELCSVPSYRFDTGQNSELTDTRVEADEMLRDGDSGTLRLNGNVTLQRNGQSIRAEDMVLDQKNNHIEASGTVVYEDPDFRLQTESFRLNQNNHFGKLLASRFRLKNQHARGTATQIDILGKSRTKMHNLLYTSCDPGDQAWYLRGDTLEIDDESGLGTARNVTLYFHDVPFIYLPYFKFWTKDLRTSGILAPRLKLARNNISHLVIPVYWNIAENVDTTFSPAWYNARGVQYTSEHRYLFPHHSGQIDFSYLEDKVEGKSRWLEKWHHSMSYKNAQLKGDILLQEVSDEHYLRDFDLTIPGSDEIDHLDRHLLLSYDSTLWTGTVFWQNYQTVDEKITVENRPYQRLPRITLNSRFQPQANGLQFNLQNELVQFKRDSSISGRRTHLSPSLSWSRSDSWYFFKPQLRYTITEYSLNHDGSDKHPASILRTIPIASLDTGLIFERNPHQAWVQTLEPRLYFVHIPYKDQSNIPDFDTSLAPETYINFFQPNRFRGIDRIGDTDQLTFGLSSRIYNTETGDELAHAQIAQVFYARDRRVSLNGVVEKRDSSNIIAQLSITPNDNLSARTEFVYQQSTSRFVKKELSVQWRKNSFIANLEYFNHNDTLEQIIVSMAYPMNERWRFVTKYHYSLLLDKAVENLFGLNYESCCWGFNMLASELSDDDFQETTRALSFELVLKGLARSGKRVDERLKRVIPGYQSGF